MYFKSRCAHAVYVYLSLSYMHILAPRLPPAFILASLGPTFRCVCKLRLVKFLVPVLVLARRTSVCSRRLGTYTESNISPYSLSLSPSQARQRFIPRSRTNDVIYIPRENERTRNCKGSSGIRGNFNAPRSVSRLSRSHTHCSVDLFASNIIPRVSCYRIIYARFFSGRFSLIN